MSAHLQDSVVQVTSSDQTNRVVGTGFAIDRDEQGTYFLTCKHVVTTAGGATQIKVIDRPAEMVASGSEEGLDDVAVLRADDLLNVPILRLRVSGEAGSGIKVAGFQPFGEGLLIRSIPGTLGERIGLEARQRLERIVAWDLLIAGDFDLERGYSGAPVIDNDTGDATAVANYRIGGRRGVAISIRTVDKIWPGILSRTQATYLRGISERRLEIYLTGSRVGWDKNPLLRYSETPEGYQLLSLSRELFGLNSDEIEDKLKDLVGEEFKHFVACERADVGRIDDILTQAGYAVTGDGTEEPGDPNKWRLWFLRRDYKVTDDDYEHPESTNLWFVV